MTDPPSTPLPARLREQAKCLRRMSRDYRLQDIDAMIDPHLLIVWADQSDASADQLEAAQAETTRLKAELEAVVVDFAQSGVRRTQSTSEATRCPWCHRIQCRCGECEVGSER